MATGNGGWYSQFGCKYELAWLLKSICRGSFMNPRHILFRNLASSHLHPNWLYHPSFPVAILTENVYNSETLC